jgi:NAD(P)-dependent dehydrogenase (short-subunit alcohol dehydrogenase family)
MPTTTAAPAVLVTGASRGLGAVMTERLAHEGYRVFAGLRQQGAPVGNGIVPVTIDVTSPASIARAVASVEARLEGDGLHALVNNAALLHAGPAETTTSAQIEAQLRTNVAGPLVVTQGFLPLLRRGQSRIVNIGSINAQLPLPYWAVYSATKAALLALSDALRMELAPWRIGVTVLTLGAFATDMRSRAQAAWTTDTDDRYEHARQANSRLVAMLDSTASDPGLVADALVHVLQDDTPPAHLAVGGGIDDLLALAAQPADVRAAVLQQLLDQPERPGAVE